MFLVHTHIPFGLVVEKSCEFRTTTPMYRYRQGTVQIHEFATQTIE